ncbi:unnamed protein product, partial [Symbiodinium necroappetens]
SWDPGPFLSDELYMAYCEPRTLLRLLRWPDCGILWACFALLLPEPAPDRDRMIIDRRGQNYAECRRQAIYCAATDSLLCASLTRSLLCFLRALLAARLVWTAFQIILVPIFGTRRSVGSGIRDGSPRVFVGGTAGAQGLVIDDFFSVSVHDDADSSAPGCLGHLATAKAIYASEGLAGSDDKDVLGSTFAKIAGGELNSSSGARAQGLITIAAPASKRVALSVVTLEAARFQHVTDVLLLSMLGSWTSAALFRPKLYGLSRPAAQELVIMSVLSTLAASEISAPLSPLLFATDASEHKGGYVAADVGAEVIRFDDREVVDLRLLRDSFVPTPSRPLAFFFDFLEVSIKVSPVYDIMQLRFGSWPSWRSASLPKGSWPGQPRSVRALSATTLPLVYGPGLESYVLNDIVTSVTWRDGDSWYWPYEDCRAGRFLSLTPILRKIGALCLAAGLFPVYHYALGIIVLDFTFDIDLADLFDLQPQTTRKLNLLLTRYGRELFEAGWPYSHYSEVINAVSGKEPALRRSLQPAWDLAFAWLREEPHSHHVALPWQVLLAMVTTSIMWGWPRVAGMLALTWGALMRVGETLAARRRDLLLPSDVGDTVSYGL